MNSDNMCFLDRILKEPILDQLAGDLVQVDPPLLPGIPVLFKHVWLNWSIVRMCHHAKYSRLVYRSEDDWAGNVQTCSLQCRLKLAHSPLYQSTYCPPSPVPPACTHTAPSSTVAAALLTLLPICSNTVNSHSQTYWFCNAAIDFWE